MAQQDHWDPVTRAVIDARRAVTVAQGYFSAAERRTAGALLDRLLDLGEPPAVPVLALIEQRLAQGRGDGWRYHDMPEDGQAWRESLAGLDADAAVLAGTTFAALSSEQQDRVLATVHGRAPDHWHGLPAGHVWNLWTRYGCTALYSHPDGWQEIGFPGPAYPRGYRSAHLGAREPFEVSDRLGHAP
jgi:hypothetical protein